METEEILEEEKVNNEALDDSAIGPVSTKRTIKNLVMVLFSNVFAILSGILVGFIIPKMMEVSGYGYYKAFSLYTSYIGLLHLGFIDGIYLKLAGTKYEAFNKEKFRFYCRFLFGLQIIMMAIVCSISLFFLSTYYFYILLFVALDVLAVNFITYYEFISQITLRFKLISLRNIIRNTINILAIVSLWLYHSICDVYINPLIYIGIVVAINYLMALWYLFSYKELSFGKAAKFSECKQEIKMYFTVGMQLLLANIIGQLMFVADQQVVNIFFPNEEYATYAFAYTMINLITIATSAISGVLYPTLKTMSNETIKHDYGRLNAYLLMFVAFCLIIYFPLDWFIHTFLDKYVSSLKIFIIILPGVLISSSIAVIKYNCYKTFNMVRRYFFISLIMLGVAIASDVACYFIFRNTESISIVSLVVLFIWYMLVESYFIKNYKVHWVRNVCYMLLMIGGFYASTFIPNLILAGVSYFAYYVTLTILFNYGILKDMYHKFKNRKSEVTA